MKSAKLSMGLTVLGVLLISSVSLAQTSTATGNLAVRASVAKNCTIATTPVVFPAYDPIGANASAADDSSVGGGLTVTCTKGATATIGLGLGTHANGSAMRMSDGSSNYLEYALYSNEGRTTAWGNAAPNLVTPEAAPSKDARTFPVYGRIPGNQDVPEGAYTDTVVATVNF